MSDNVDVTRRMLLGGAPAAIAVATLGKPVEGHANVLSDQSAGSPVIAALYQEYRRTLQAWIKAPDAIADKTSRGSPWDINRQSLVALIEYPCRSEGEIHQKVGCCLSSPDLLDSICSGQYYPGFGSTTFLSAFLHSLLGEAPKKPKRAKRPKQTELPAPARKEVMEGPLPREAFELKEAYRAHLSGYQVAFEQYRDYMRSAGMGAFLWAS